MVRKIREYGSLEWCHFVRENKARFDAMQSDSFTKDGLLRCRDITIARDGHSDRFWLQKPNPILVCANKYTSTVSDYLVARPVLWQQASLRVTHGRGVYGRAPMFGVPFSQAVREAFKKGFTKSEF